MQCLVVTHAPRLAFWKCAPRSSEKVAPVHFNAPTTAQQKIMLMLRLWHMQCPVLTHAARLASGVERHKALKGCTLSRQRPYNSTAEGHAYVKALANAMSSSDTCTSACLLALSATKQPKGCTPFTSTPLQSHSTELYSFPFNTPTKLQHKVKCQGLGI